MNKGKINTKFQIPPPTRLYKLFLLTTDSAFRQGTVIFPGFIFPHRGASTGLTLLALVSPCVRRGSMTKYLVAVWSLCLWPFCFRHYLNMFVSSFLTVLIHVASVLKPEFTGLSNLGFPCPGRRVTILLFLSASSHQRRRWGIV